MLTGDAHGLLKIWDTRKALCVWSQSIENNDDKNKPISFIHVTKGNRAADEEGRYMGVNSYDNGTTGDHSYLTLPVLRVYDRGSTVFIGKQLNSQVSRDTGIYIVLTSVTHSHIHDTIAQLDRAQK